MSYRSSQSPCSWSKFEASPLVSPLFPFPSATHKTLRPQAAQQSSSQAAQCPKPVPPKSKSPFEGQPKRPLPCPGLLSLLSPSLPVRRALSFLSFGCPCPSRTSATPPFTFQTSHSPLPPHTSSSTSTSNHSTTHPQPTTHSILPTLLRVYILIDKTRIVLRLKRSNTPTDLHAPSSRTPQYQTAHLSHAVLNSRRHCLCHCQTRVARPLSTAYLNTGFTHLTAHLSQPLRQHIRTATYHTPHSFTQPSVVRPHSRNFESSRLPVCARLLL